jgi:murein L,D-transpeptidase YafK
MRPVLQKILKKSAALSALLVLAGAPPGAADGFLPLSGLVYDVSDSTDLRSERLAEYGRLLAGSKELFLAGEPRGASDRLDALRGLLETDGWADISFRREFLNFSRLVESSGFRADLPGELGDDGSVPDTTHFIFEWYDHPAELERVQVAPGEYALVVDKSNQKLFVYQYGNSWDLIKWYRCTTGKSGGDKLREGDLRTPEGIYHFTRILEDPDLHSIYGVRAFVINYPDTVDVKRGKGGDGIWLHGLDRPLIPRDTNGCVALVNGDLLDVSAYINLTGTPIVISPRVHQVGPVVRSFRPGDIAAFLREFRRAWESKETEAFQAMFSDSFLDGGRRRAAYFERKRVLAAGRDWIRVGISDVRVDGDHHQVSVDFRQDYSSPQYRDSGRKRLILRLERSGWRIYDEIWEG